MLERLLDFLISSLRLLQPWYVLTDYEGGVVLRFGRFHRMAEPGIHWLIPFGVEHLIYTNVVSETINIGPQSLTTAKTADEPAESIVISTVVTFSVSDAKAFLLTIEGGNAALEDLSIGVNSELVCRTPWSKLSDPAVFDLPNELTKLTRRRAKSWGVEIERVQIADLSRCRSLRLLQQSSGIAFKADVI